MVVKKCKYLWLVLELTLNEMLFFSFYRIKVNIRGITSKSIVVQKSIEFYEILQGSDKK